VLVLSFPRQFLTVTSVKSYIELICVNYNYFGIRHSIYLQLFVFFFSIFPFFTILLPLHGEWWLIFNVLMYILFVMKTLVTNTAIKEAVAKVIKVT